MHQTINAQQKFWRNCQAGIPAEVILGSPKSPECKNLGICRIQLERTLPLPSCKNRTIAYLRVDLPTGRLLVHFLNSSITDECAAHFFKSGVFHISEDYILSPEVVSALYPGQRIKNCRIRSGNYPVLNDDHFVSLSVRVTTKAESGVLLLAA